MTVELNEGKITANRDVLNTISLAFHEASERYEAVHCFALARDCKENANKIYDVLEASGYFKDC